MKFAALALAAAATTAAATEQQLDAYRIREDGRCVEATIVVADATFLASTGFREGACATAGFTTSSSQEHRVWELAAAGDAATHTTLFEHFQALHGKEYATSAEAAKRQAVFAKNVDLMLAHNAAYVAGEQSFWMGLTPHADLTNDEYRRTYLRLQTNPRGASALVTFNVDAVNDVPDSWDWRKDSNTSVVTPVKNQGSCGSCWAFSAVATMEGRYALDSGDLQSFSEQELVDCTMKGAYTCEEGGEMHDGVEEIAANHAGKINTETQYPYTGRDSTSCKADDSTAIDAGISGYANVTVGDEDALKAAAYARPIISVGIDASSISFQMYLGGVYDPIFCSSTNLDHGVSVVGYGTSTTGKDYWWVKNSWGATWGEKGYIEMARNHKNKCGIATDACYALSKAAPQ